MKKLQFIDIGKPFRIIGKICKDIERAFRFKGINVNFIVMMIDYIGFAFILKWNLQIILKTSLKEADCHKVRSFCFTDLFLLSTVNPISYLNAFHKKNGQLQITEIAQMCKLRYSLSNIYIPHLQELSYDHASFLKT